MPSVRYPDVVITLDSEHGNTFLLLGQVLPALRRAGLSREEVAVVESAMLNGTYEHAISVASQWVTVV